MIAGERKADLARNSKAWDDASPKVEPIRGMPHDARGRIKADAGSYKPKANSQEPKCYPSLDANFLS
jgi:hypothetical protein